MSDQHYQNVRAPDQDEINSILESDYADPDNGCPSVLFLVDL